MVTVETNAGTRDVPNWQTYCQRHANILEVEASGSRRGPIVTAEVQSEVHLLADSETVRITTQMRIRYSTPFDQEKILDIIAAPLDEEGRNRRLKIECRRNAAC